MSHIEGDGVIEDIYYLLWRKDSPFNEKLNIRIPDTVVFRNGRPMAWYYTTSGGTVMRKKQTSLIYPEILKRFTKGATEGEIVAYFVNIDHQKKLERLLDKSYYKNPPKQEAKEESDGPPCHDVEYFGLSDFCNTFSDYKKFEGKTGILQRFIHPYGSNNELIQAIWSPRVCVFTKRVNLRRLNETRFDIYERALTFDGPDFYSKNVPLRGGYIPGKLRATCDNIVSHIAFISYEKVSINRLVGYFKVDQNENVWFLWTSSIRIGEASKTHRNISQFVDKPLCLDPCMQTSTNIRHIKSNFSTRPVTLRMTEECSICAIKVSSVSLIPVIYRLLIGNEEILKKSEKHGAQHRIIKAQRAADESVPLDLKNHKKTSVGVPYFLKNLHPEMSLKEFQNLKEKEHFLMMKTLVCEECYLLVSKEYEGGFPCSLNDNKERSQLKSARPTRRRGSSIMNETQSRRERSATPDRSSQREYFSNVERKYDTVKETNSQAYQDLNYHLTLPSDPNRQSSPESRAVKSHRLNINPEPVHPSGQKIGTGTTSTMYATVSSNKSVNFPAFLNKTSWMRKAKSIKKIDRESLGESHFEETKLDSRQQDHSNLRKDVIKALSGILDDKDFASAKSMNKAISMHSLNQINSARKISRPQTTFAIANPNKKGRILKPKQEDQNQLKYKLEEVPDLFDDSNSSEGFEAIKQTVASHRQYSTYQTAREPRGKNSVAEIIKAPGNTQHSEPFQSARSYVSAEKGMIKLKGYLSELSPETKIQDHLDQDIVLTMENAMKQSENPYTFKAHPPSILKTKKKIANNSYSYHTDKNSSKNFHSPYDLTSASGRSTNIRSKQQPTPYEKNAAKEFEDKLESIIDKYYESNKA